MLKITLFCVAYLLIKTDVVWCKPDYFFRPEAVGWFKVHQTPETWQEALLKCHYEGAVLASPLNEALANALNLLCEQSFGGNSFFLGTQDLFSRGDFLSVEGVLLSDFEIKSELREMGNGRCLTMSYTSQTPYELRSTSCEDLLPYICYRRLDNETLNQCGTFDNEYRFNENTGSCYKVHPEKHTWNRAHRICVAEGGDLVILNDNEEARIVRDMFPESPILQDREPLHIDQDWEPLHIGLLAWGEKDHTWMTVHGEKIEDVYHAWTPGLNNYQYGDELRATLHRSGGLGVRSADTKAIFVCEKSPDSIRFETPPLAIEYEIQ